MQKNWYIIYTKAKCEKKVATTLTKRKIENFLPHNSKPSVSFRKRKLHSEPLFDCYVFANLNESEIPRIREIDGIVNLVYWKGKPAVIRNEEIDAIKEFIIDYQDIKLEKTQIKLNDFVKVINGPEYLMEGNLLTIKNTTIKVNLPSLGFSMVAKVNSENGLSPEVAFGKKELLYQS
jgi:transcription antitermination factor NusG